jgi:rubrerythrin
MTPELTLKLMEQFKKEMDDVLKYRELEKATDDEYLEEALTEIEHDEYLHAKFLRSYLWEQGVYKPAEHIECEKKWTMIND